MVWGHSNKKKNLWFNLINFPSSQSGEERKTVSILTLRSQQIANLRDTKVSEDIIILVC